MCEAEEALTHLVYELELQWGSGRLDLGRLKGIAAGAKCGAPPAQIEGTQSKAC